MADKTDKAQKTFAAIGVFILSIPIMAALMAINVLWSGFVLSKLWGWFVSPIFGIRPLTVLMASGICLAISCTRGTPYRDPSKSPWKILYGEFTRDTIILLAGFVVRRFI